ncbi:hypothetical protein F5Y15DRAFT_390849 [Xylariaceae sp. FL0016]|nr:hypothetical protein F5Y15DRAFT_390849 [Xylariaceae sp. FL0016]
MAKPTRSIINGPAGSLTVVFRDASPEQRVQCSMLAAPAFGSPLSVADYVERDEYLGKQPLTVDGGWRFWCLVTDDDDERVLATCKTMNRPLLIRDSTGCREEQGYCVVSVVTQPEYRGCGLASLLVENVKVWMDGPSMLYTSIGDFYAKRGWRTHPVPQSTLSAPLTRESLRTQDCQMPATRALGKDEIGYLCIRDVRDVKSHMERIPVESEETHVAAIPTADLVGWLHSRSYFIALKALGKAPHRYGSICEVTDTWIYWYHDFKERQLWIQRVRVPPGIEDDQALIDGLASILIDALEEASAWYLPTVVIRDPLECVRRAMQRISDRYSLFLDNDALTGQCVASVRLHGSAGPRTTVTLQFNELYAWS